MMFGSKLVFQYEKFFQNTPYFSFWLVIGQISSNVWKKSSLEIKKERELTETKKSPCIF